MKTMKIPSPKKKATPLNGYVNFHGMLCHPKTAKRCIQSFDGNIVFAPTGYSESTLPMFEYSSGSSLLRLNIFTYYLLVLTSLTGLATLCRQTRFLAADEKEETLSAKEPFVSSFHPELRVEPFVWNYIAPSEESITLQRRFEYEFKGFVPIKVLMLHIMCKDRLHLVEVYQCDNRFFRGLLQRVQQLMFRLRGTGNRKRE
jgi:hypothetical protein